MAPPGFYPHRVWLVVRRFQKIKTGLTDGVDSIRTRIHRFHERREERRAEKLRMTRSPSLSDHNLSVSDLSYHSSEDFDESPPSQRQVGSVRFSAVPPGGREDFKKESGDSSGNEGTTHASLPTNKKKGEQIRDGGDATGLTLETERNQPRRETWGDMMRSRSRGVFDLDSEDPNVVTAEDDEGEVGADVWTESPEEDSKSVRKSTLIQADPTISSERGPRLPNPPVPGIKVKKHGGAVQTLISYWQALRRRLRRSSAVPPPPERKPARLERHELPQKPKPRNRLFMTPKEQRLKHGGEIPDLKVKVKTGFIVRKGEFMRTEKKRRALQRAIEESTAPNPVRTARSKKSKKIK